MVLVIVLSVAIEFGFNRSRVMGSDLASDRALDMAVTSEDTDNLPASSLGSHTRVDTDSNIAVVEVGATLPTESECASRVRPMTENRPDNAPYNSTRGNSANDDYTRVTGNFIGTTDEIIQWAACKWGFDVDWARAQAALESAWRHNSAFSDYGTDPSACVPGHTLGSDGRPGECPQSVGLLQIRYPFHPSAFENNNAINSTAYNADYVYAWWRACYEGEITWLNTVERGSEYAAGDALGCIGVHNAGRWYTDQALAYVDRLRIEYYNLRYWRQDFFPPAMPR